MSQKTQKNLEFTVLLDFYGAALTEKQRTVLDEYYNEDLSLAEIAEYYGITRQGVRDAIKHGETVLLELEDKLGNVRRHQAMMADLERAQQLVCEIRCDNGGRYEMMPRIEKDSQELLKILDRISAMEETPDGI